MLHLCCVIVAQKCIEIFSSNYSGKGVVLWIYDQKMSQMISSKHFESLRQLGISRQFLWEFDNVRSKVKKLGLIVIKNFK